MDADTPRPVAVVESPVAVVERFLAALADGDTTAAAALLDRDVVYTNVSVATLRGRRRTTAVLDLLARPWAGFAVAVHHVAADGPVVLTERTDELRVGRVRSRFWVCGRFEVHDGAITVWRDYFDLVDVGRGTVRGLAAVLAPRLQRPMLPAPPR